MSPFAKAIDWFVPRGLGRIDAGRARVLVLASFGLALAGSTTFVVRSLFVGRFPTSSAIASAIALSLFAFTPVVLRATGSLRAAAPMLPAVALVAVGAISYAEGGLNVPVLSVVVILPIFVMFFSGALAAWLWGGAALALLWGLFALGRTGRLPPQPDIDFDVMRALTYSVTVVLAGATAWLFERQRRLAQDDVARSDERYALAAEAASDGLFDWDLVQDATFYSDRFRELLGYAPGDELPTNPFAPELVAPEDQDYVRRESRAQLDAGRAFDVEFRMIRADGERAWFEARCRLVRGAAGAPQRMIGSIRDISERKEAERLKDEFIATVSHELRTPLTSIHGALGLLAGGAIGELPSEAREMIELAMRNTDRLTSLVGDLLDLQRIERGDFDIADQDIDAVALVEDAVEVNRGLTDRYDVSFEVTHNGDATHSRIRGDARRLLQVITNFMANAAKYSPKRDRVELGVSVRGDRVRVFVSDRGPGIPPEFGDRVFERFAQADSSSTRTHGGSGLGLAIAKAIIDAHGGAIGFEPRSPGTTFYFELPRAGSPGASAATM